MENLLAEVGIAPEDRMRWWPKIIEHAALSVHYGL
jgi:hypothetical protein